MERGGGGAGRTVRGVRGGSRSAPGGCERRVQKPPKRRDDDTRHLAASSIDRPRTEPFGFRQFCAPVSFALVRTPPRPSHHRITAFVQRHSARRASPSCCAPYSQQQTRFRKAPKLRPHLAELRNVVPSLRSRERRGRRGKGGRTAAARRATSGENNLRAATRAFRARIATGVPLPSPAHGRRPVLFPLLVHPPANGRGQSAPAAPFRGAAPT